MAQWKAGSFLGSLLWFAMQSLLLIPVQVWGSADERISVPSTIALPSCTARNNKEQSSFHRIVSRGLHFPPHSFALVVFSANRKSGAYLLSELVASERLCSKLSNDKEKGWLPATISQSKDKTYCRRKRFAETSCNIILWNLTWFAQPRSALSHTAPNFSLSSNGYKLFFFFLLLFFLMLALMHVPCPQWSYHRFNICLQLWISPPVIPNLIPAS